MLACKEPFYNVTPQCHSVTTRPLAVPFFTLTASPPDRLAIGGNSTNAPSNQNSTSVTSQLDKIEERAPPAFESAHVLCRLNATRLFRRASLGASERHVHALLSLFK